MENTSTKRLVDELIEDSDLNQKIIKTFNTKSTLTPAIFGNDQKMHKNVRNKLLKISDLFIEFIGIDFFIHFLIIVKNCRC